MAEQERISGLVHVNDYRAFRKLLVDEELSMSRFIEACVEAYVNGDPHMLRVIQRYKERFDEKREQSGSHMLSQRERNSLLEELEADGEKG